MAGRARGLMLAAAAILAVLLAFALRYGPATAPGQALIERSLAGLKLGRVGRLRIEGLRGDPWSSFRVARLTIVDGRGVWLEARDLRARWRPAELLARRAHFEYLTARRVSLRRFPALTPPTKPSPLPVGVRLDAVSTQVELSPEIGWRRGLYDLGGAFRIERGGAMRLTAVAESRLHAGDFLKLLFFLGEDHAFRLRARANEAQGGALSGVLGLDPNQPFQLTADGAGSLRGGHLTLLTRVGGATPLDVQGAWNGARTWAQGRIDLGASRLLAPYARRIGPSAVFDMAGTRAADGFDRLTLGVRADNLSLAARGEANLGRLAVGPHGVAFDLKVADPNRLTPAPTLGPAEIRGGLGGDRRRLVVVAQGQVARLSAPGYNLANLTVPLRLDLGGGETTLEASAAGEGGAGKGLAATLLGARPRASGTVTLLADGRVLIRAFRLDGAGLKVSAMGTRGLLGGLSLRGEATLANLAAAHTGARGLVQAGWSASQAAPARPWSFAFDARARGFAAGLAEIDRLMGPAPRLRANGALGREGVVSLAAASLDGAAGSARAAGLIGPAGALRLKLDWKAHGPFEIGPLVVSGAATGRGDIGGSLASPSADLIADFGAIDLPMAPLRPAHLTLRFASTPTGVAGVAAIAGQSQYGPARAKADFRFAPGGVDLSGVDVKAAGVTATGSLALRSNAPSRADLDLAIGPGALLSQGSASARLRIVDATGGPRAELALKASGAALRQGGLTVRSLSLIASGSLARLPYEARADGVAPQGPWRLAGSGVLSRSAADTLITFNGAGRLGRADIKTVQAAELRTGPRGQSARMALGIGAGRADLMFAQTAGGMSAKAKAVGLNLGLLNQDYVGRVDGDLELSGRGPDLVGRFQAHLSGAGGRDLRGVAPIGGTVDAVLGRGAMTVNVALGDGKGMKAAGQVVLPTEASASPFRIAINRKAPMRGRFDVDGELRPLWDLTYGGETTLSGRLVASGTIGGTLADPRATGSASLDDGRFADAATGLKLEKVSLRATLSDTGVDISRFSGGDGARGEVTGSGRIDLYRDSISSFHLDLRNFRLIDNDLGQATASGQVSVNRAADGKVRLAGRLRIDRATIAPNPPVPSGVTPMDVVEIHEPSAVEAHEAPATKPQAPVDLDVALVAPGGVFIRGRGLNLELSLDAHVGGATAAPILTGTARVARGDYNFAGKRFLIGDRGVIYLGSTAETVRLDLTATRDDPTLSAAIRIQGTAARPVITLTSTPVLPQDEILSQLLFGASAAQLGPLEAAQLASALAGLAGTGGFDLIGGLRNFTHLDRLAFASGATTGTTVSGGKYIRDNVYLEITGGGRQGSSAQVEWRVKRHLSLLSRLTSQGDSQLSVRWRKDY